MQGGFCCIALQTVHIVNFTQTHYKISQKNYKKILKKAKVQKNKCRYNKCKGHRALCGGGDNFRSVLQNKHQMTLA